MKRRVFSFYIVFFALALCGCSTTISFSHPVEPKSYFQPARLTGCESGHACTSSNFSSEVSLTVGPSKENFREFIKSFVLKKEPNADRKSVV